MENPNNYSSICSTDSKHIYHSGDNVLIYHSHSEAFNLITYGPIEEQKEHYKCLVNIYKLVEAKLDGRLISEGQFYPELPIIYEMPYRGDSLYNIIYEDKKVNRIAEIIELLQVQLPDIIRNLCEKNLVHWDLALRNITLYDGIIYLVDYDSIQPLVMQIHNKDDIKLLFWDIYDDLLRIMNDKNIIKPFIRILRNIVEEYILL